MKKLNEILGKSSDSDTMVSAGANSSIGDNEPACPHCGGTGFVRRAVPVEHADFGRALPCQCILSESDDQRLSRLLRYSNLGELARHTFETLVRRGRSGLAEHQERFSRAVKIAEGYAAAP